MSQAVDRLIVALDLPSVQQSEKMIEQLGDSVSFYKIGYRLAFAGGLELARDLVADGKQVFLDMKLLDIDNTIANGVESVVKMGVQMLTLHAYPKAMAAAVDAAKGTNLCLLGVTVLTSMDDADLKDAHYSLAAGELVQKRALQARDAGMGGIVCSPLEAASIRQSVGSEMAIVTPGIRPSGSDAGDQKRIATPASAISDGASHLVVGRPIYAADNPKQAAESIITEISGAIT